MLYNIPMHRRHLNVIANFNIRHKAARDMITGIMRYAASNPRWELQLLGNHPSNDGFSILASDAVDGIITGYNPNDKDEPDQDYVQQVLRHGTALKGMTVISVPLLVDARIPCTRIDIDHHEVARCAARLFLNHGFQHFAYIGSPLQEPWSVERAGFFRQEIQRHGYSVHEFTTRNCRRSKQTNGIDKLKQWLIGLPKPCGVFAAYDQRAKHVIDVCRQNHIGIPKEIQVVGVDNENSICELTVPTLSSIAPDFELAGFTAAHELDKLMRNRHQTNMRTILIKPTTVIERLSTSDLTRSGDRVTRALEFIRMHCGEPIGVHQAARAVGGSVRLLEKDFKSVLGKGICQVIQDHRLKLVAQSLRETSAPLSSIAKTSGFSSETYLKNLFKSRFGMTMTEFRRQRLNPLI